jgi:hypothetical protein
MIVEKLCSLPDRIEYQGLNFELRITVNRGGGSLTFGYFIIGISKFSRHLDSWNALRLWKNPFKGGALLDHLFQRVVIHSDAGLMDAIRDCRTFLVDNKLS